MRICYYELSNYNAGKLIARWFDLEGQDKESHTAEIQAWLKEISAEHDCECCSYEEYIVADVEGLPRCYASEYELSDDAWPFIEAYSNSHLDYDVFIAGAALGYKPDEIESHFYGIFETVADFGYSILGAKIEDAIGNKANYFNFERYALNELLIDDFSRNGRYYFTN